MSGHLLGYTTAWASGREPVSMLGLQISTGRTAPIRSRRQTIVCRHK